MRYVDGKFVTDEGMPMSRLTKLVIIILKQNSEDIIRQKLEHPDNARLVTGIKMEAGREFAGFSREEFAVEVLSDIIGRLMHNLAEAIDKDPPQDIDDPLATLAMKQMVTTTVCGIGLTHGICKTELS